MFAGTTMVDDDYTPKYAELKLMSHVGQKGQPYNCTVAARAMPNWVFSRRAAAVIHNRWLRMTALLCFWQKPLMQQSRAPRSTADVDYMCRRTQMGHVPSRRTSIPPQAREETGPCDFWRRKWHPGTPLRSPQTCCTAPSQTCTAPSTQTHPPQDSRRALCWASWAQCLSWRSVPRGCPLTL